ncbi:hypothetical protein [Halorubellus litoreus]|uniref:DoxX family protein n=1 Tax=Halorubellus litoreus TaxID=755308 RepID=A0ABD5VAJ1_9EURY
MVSRTVELYSDGTDYVVDRIFVPYGTQIAFATYAFVFFYYGMLKIQAFLTGMTTPVKGEVAHFVTALGLPEIGVSVGLAMLSIGLYEALLGLLFVFRRLRLAIPLFLSHQFVTFLSLVVARDFYFQDPFLFGVPWLFDSFAAYILKNTIFVGGFVVLAALELGDRTPETVLE